MRRILVSIDRARDPARSPWSSSSSAGDGGCHVHGRVCPYGGHDHRRRWTCAASGRRSRASRSEPRVRFLNTGDIDARGRRPRGELGAGEAARSRRRSRRRSTTAGTYPSRGRSTPGMVGAIVVGGARRRDGAAPADAAASGWRRRRSCGAAAAVTSRSRHRSGRPSPSSRLGGLGWAPSPGRLVAGVARLIRRDASSASRPTRLRPSSPCGRSERRPALYSAASIHSAYSLCSRAPDRPTPR